MRLGALGAVAALGACLALAAAAEARPRALVAYLPAEDNGELLRELAARDLSYGLVSPTLGGYSPRQMALDVGQGSRISTRAYDERVPELRLVGERILRWRKAVERAEDAPGDAVPGLLAQTVAEAGGRVAYAGVAGAEQVEALSAADRAGRIGEVRVAAPARLPRELLALRARATLVVARLPAGERGLAALDRLLAARAPDELVLAVRAPPPGGLQLVAAGAAGPGFGGGRLTSDTTRLDGVVAATDVAPTVLERLGLERPDEMTGRPMERAGGGTPQGLLDTASRFDVILDRRVPVLRAALVALLVLLAALAALRGRDGLRTWLRLAPLAALWLPGLALVTAALRPGRTAEIAILVLGSLALAAVTDRLVPWPRGPALPAAVVVLAHAIDLGAGSALIDASLAGPNPKGGARFYGIGNELETILAISVLVGTGAAVATRRAPRAFAGACIVAGVVIGAGRLGADVGGVIVLGAGGAAAVLVSLRAGGGRRLSRRAVVLAVLAPILAVAALAALDLATGGGAHLTRSVIEADDPGDLVDVVERRFRISFGGVGGGTAPLSVSLAVLMLIGGAVWRQRLLRPLAAAPGLRAGLIGAWFATVAGALANDSGPVIVLIGTAGLLLAVGYVWGRPARAPGTASSRMPRCV